MELSYFHEFVTLANTCQFVEAAERLYMSQSSLSKHIKTMEKELGRELFDRSTRKVELTRFGREFLPYAKRIASVQAEYTNILMPEFSSESCVISIGVSPLVSFLSISNMLSSFSRNNNEIQTKIFEADDATMVDALRNGKCTAIITGLHPLASFDCSDLDTIPLFEDTLVALLPVGHPLSGKGSVAVEELSSYPYIHAGRDANHNPALGAPVISASHSALVLELVRKGMGISIITKQVALTCQDDQLTYVAMSPSPKIQVSMIFNQNRLYSRDVRLLVQHLQNFKPFAGV